MQKKTSFRTKQGKNHKIIDVEPEILPIEFLSFTVLPTVAIEKGQFYKVEYFENKIGNFYLFGTFTYSTQTIFHAP